MLLVPAAILFQMSQSVVRIKLRISSNEVEIESPANHLKEAIDLIPDVLQRLPQPQRIGGASASVEEAERVASRATQALLPEIKVERGDSLSDVITRIFKESWARAPRKLNEVKAVLESYGLIYPKQSVAVALLRLAQAGKLRRFKDEAGEFVYTVSTGLAAEGLQQIRHESLNLAGVEKDTVAVEG